MQLVVGIILGIMISAIGFTGIANYLDKGVAAVQQATKEVTK